MSKPLNDSWVAYPTGFYRLALWVLPGPFRREYSEEMQLVFKDCCLEAYRSKGWLGALTETAKGTFDLATNAFKERADDFFSDRGRQYAFVVVSFLGMCGGLFIANSSVIDGAPDPIFLAYLFAFTLACLRPKGFWLIGLVIGAMIPFLELGLFTAVAGSVSGALFRQGLDYGAKRFA